MTKEEFKNKMFAAKYKAETGITEIKNGLDLVSRYFSQ